MEVDVEPFVISVTVPTSVVGVEGFRVGTWRGNVAAQTVASNVTVRAASSSVSASEGSVVLTVPTPGPPGPTGPAGSGTQVFGEVPSGAQNGTNESFTLAHGFQVGSTAVYRNGLRER